MSGIINIDGLAIIKAIDGNVDVMLDLPSIIKLIESNSNDKQIFSVRFA